jgi:creatinine amidohydrolase/Fe(II)-dependent formamide hydrolase-like protein
MTNRHDVPRLADLTWPEAADWFRRDPRLIWPVGSLMQHGPHLPLDTDTRIIEALAAGIASRHGVLLAPTLPFGACSDVDRGYAGTGAVGHKTLHRALNDVVGGWADQGLRDLVLFTSNGFGSHYRALVSVMAGDVRIRAVDANVVDVSPALRTPRTPERAGEVETALAMYLFPELVRHSAVEDAEMDRDVQIARLDGTEPVPPPGSSGVVGRPTAATAAKGRRVYEYLVEYIGERLFGREAPDENEPSL